MELVLLRHAQKENVLHNDPSLNSIGLQQAVFLKDAAQSGLLPSPTHLVASEKIRTQQTLNPLAKEFGVSLSIWPEADERASNESASEFNQRIYRAQQKISYLKEGCLYLCTHYDWLVEGLPLFSIDDTNLKTVERLRFEAFIQTWSPTQSLHLKLNENGQWSVVHLFKNKI